MKLAAMDPDKVAQVLHATLDPSQREATEKHLQEFHKIVGFTPTLLHVVMSEKYEVPVRQAGVIYLKNMVTQFWANQDTENPSEPLPFNIHENDRAVIRQNIVDAIIHAPEPIRVQLCVCISNVIKHDYPERFADVGNKIATYLQSPNPAELMGSLMCLHQLVKNYEYKLAQERAPLNEPIQQILPIIYQHCVRLMPDASDMALLLQKQIFKIFYALTQNYLPLEQITRPVFTQWMQLLRDVLMKPLREDVAEVDEDERPELPCWKLKKWATHIMARMFERYGSPGNVTKTYTQFAEWYIKSFSMENIQCLLKILEQYRQKQYIAPRVLQQTLNYLHHAVSHAQSWKFLKVYIHTIIQEVVFPLMCHNEEDDEMWNNDPLEYIHCLAQGHRYIISYLSQTIIQEVVFPLMCHNEEDDEMWNNDPLEYIRIKFDVFEDFLSPVMAAQALLHSSIAKRKDVLHKTMGFCMQVMTTPDVDPRKKDGALHILGSVADIILKRKIYKDQAELVLTQHVFPEFHSQHGFLRAKACWVLHYFSELKYKQSTTLIQAIEYSKNALVTDKDLPVRVEAAIALQMLVTEQEAAQNYIKPHLKTVIIELLNIIRETENDDLTNVLQKLVLTYVDDIAPMAVEMTQHLAQMFCTVVESDTDGSEEKAVTALGLLSTMETILTLIAQMFCTVVESDTDGSEEKAVTALGLLSTMETILTVIVEQSGETDTQQTPDANVIKLEEILLNVIGLVLQKNVLDFYEEILTLIYTLTSSHISTHMWQVYRMLYEMFQSDGIDYFTDMMPALHNYITVDGDGFLSNTENMEIIYNMCKKVFEMDMGEDAECHAAKLLEVILLQHKGKVDQVMSTFIQLVLNRLTQPIKTSELRTMCLQVVIAALYCNPEGLIQILSALKLPNSDENVVSHFLKQWISDTECFLGLHDRKMSILGLCALMNTAVNRPTEINEIASQIIPSMLVLFAGIKRAYASRAQDGENEDDDDDEEDESDNDEEAEDDDDVINERDSEYLEQLEESANAEDSDSDDEDYGDDSLDETALESYETPLDEESSTIDEYIEFKSILQRLESSEPTWYNTLICHLTDEQRKQLGDVFTLADQRKAAADSKKIEEAGGYQFPSLAVPNSFNFSNIA